MKVRNILKVHLTCRINTYFSQISLFLMGLLVLTSKINCADDANLIEQFLNTKVYKNLAMYEIPKNDELYEDILSMASYRELHISTTPITKLIDTYYTLEIFHEPNFEDVKNLLNQPGIQFELSINTWLIFSSITIEEVKSLFSDMKFKMGLNANIFFVLKSNGKTHLVQVLGTGTSEVEIVVS